MKPPHLSMVTEYMEIGSLYYLIHSSGQKKMLSWRKRLKMLRDICRLASMSVMTSSILMFFVQLLFLNLILDDIKLPIVLLNQMTIPYLVLIT